jgi:proline racemase
MKTLEYLDFHVAGEPFRLITRGFPEIIGSTMAEKRHYATAHLDNLRKIALLEPRGHDDMYGGFLTPPVNEESDLGIVFIHGTGMSTMCGHGAIAMARAACELGIATLKEGMNTVTLDAPSGSVQLAVQTEGGKISDIALKNDLSFAYALDELVQTPSYGKVSVDVGYGGAFMVFADIRQFGIELEAENIQAMLDIAMECGRCAIDQLAMVHPENPALNAKENGICMILFAEDGESERVISTRTFTVFGKRQFDRSPTGTGTSALAAVLHGKGRLHEGKKLENRGISGIPFIVTIEETERGQVIPTIHSRAYLMGKGSILLEEDDPLQQGFSMKTGNEVEI